ATNGALPSTGERHEVSRGLRLAVDLPCGEPAAGGSAPAPEELPQVSVPAAPPAAPGPGDGPPAPRPQAGAGGQGPPGRAAGTGTRGGPPGPAWVANPARADGARAGGLRPGLAGDGPGSNSARGHARGFRAPTRPGGLASGRAADGPVRGARPGPRPDRGPRRAGAGAE